MGTFVLALNLNGALMMAHGEHLAGQKDQRSDTVYRRSNGHITDDDPEVNFDGGRDRTKAEAPSRLTSISDKNKSQVDGQMATLKQDLDKVINASKAKPTTRSHKQPRQSKVQVDVNALLVDIEDLRKRYIKAILPVCNRSSVLQSTSSS